MARVNSQLILCFRHQAAFAQSLRERVDQDGREIQSFGTIRVACDDQAIAWQGLAMNDLAQVVGKVFEWREAA